MSTSKLVLLVVLVAMVFAMVGCSAGASAPSKVCMNVGDDLAKTVDCAAGKGTSATVVSFAVDAVIWGSIHDLCLNSSKDASKGVLPLVIVHGENAQFAVAGAYAECGQLHPKFYFADLARAGLVTVKYQ